MQNSKLQFQNPKIKSERKNIQLSNGVTLAYEIIGHGKPLVLIHSWGFLWFKEKLFIDLLSKKFQLYIPELPGYGESTQGKLQGTVEEYAEVVKEFLDKMKIAGQAKMVGLSMGAVVLLAFVNNFPEFSKRTILFGLPFARDLPFWAKIIPVSLAKTVIFASPPLTKLMVNYIYYQAERENTNTTKYKKRYPGKIKYQLLIENMISILNSPKEKTYSDLKNKPTLLYGEYDRLKNWAQEKGIAFQEIPGGDHVSIEIKPAETARMIIEILKN